MLCLSTNALINPTCNAGTELNSRSELCALKNIMTMTIDDADDDHWKCRKNMCKQNESVVVVDKKQNKNKKQEHFVISASSYQLFNFQNEIKYVRGNFPPKMRK